MVMLIPVPDESVIDHWSRTITLPPIVTVLGDAVNELMVGAGQALAVTVVCAELVAPHPDLAFNV